MPKKAPPRRVAGMLRTRLAAGRNIQRLSAAPGKRLSWLRKDMSRYLRGSRKVIRVVRTSVVALLVRKGNRDSLRPLRSTSVMSMMRRVVMLSWRVATARAIRSASLSSANASLANRPAITAAMTSRLTGTGDRAPYLNVPAEPCPPGSEQGWHDHERGEVAGECCECHQSAETCQRRQVADEQYGKAEAQRSRVEKAGPCDRRQCPVDCLAEITTILLSCCPQPVYQMNGEVHADTQRDGCEHRRCRLEVDAEVTHARVQDQYGEKHRYDRDQTRNR